MGDNLTLEGCPTYSVIHKYVIKTYKGLDSTKQLLSYNLRGLVSH